MEWKKSNETQEEDRFNRSLKIEERIKKLENEIQKLKEGYFLDFLWLLTLSLILYFK